MSLGFGKVKVTDWEKVKSGSTQDDVPAGDYFALVNALRDIPPQAGASAGGKSFVTLVVEFKTSEDNEASWQGKQLERRFSWHPNPAVAGEKADGYEKMNEMTLTDMAQLVEAANAAPIMDGDQIDVVATVRSLVNTKPKVLCAVTHRTVDGKTYQEVGKFRPVSG